MSDQPNPEVKSDEKNAKIQEEEEPEYSCSLCWNGYCDCIFCTCKVFLNFLIP